MYAYATSNPLTLFDPDGRDAVTATFSKLAGGAGHVAVMSVHRDGSATYAQFGPRGGGKPASPGQIDVIPLKTRIQFDDTGVPTGESFAKLTHELSTIEGQHMNSISLAYFKTTEAETVALDAYLEEARRTQESRKSPFYLVGYSDCIHFCVVGLQKAGIGFHASPGLIPNVTSGQFAFWAHWSYNGSTGGKKKGAGAEKTPDVHSTICFGGQAGCPIQ